MFHFPEFSSLLWSNDFQTSFVKRIVYFRTLHSEWCVPFAIFHTHVIRLSTRIFAHDEAKSSFTATHNHSPSTSFSLFYSVCIVFLFIIIAIEFEIIVHLTREKVCLSHTNVGDYIIYIYTYSFRQCQVQFNAPHDVYKVKWEELAPGERERKAQITFVISHYSHPYPSVGFSRFKF